MYTIQLPTGEFLDVPKGFGLAFDLTSQIFSSARSDLLPGSYSFPADLPLTAHNKVLLNQPQLIQHAYKWQKIEDVWIYCHGLRLFTGTLTILGADDDKVRITVVASAMKGLKEKPLNEYDLGGDRSVGTEAENLAFMVATAQRPEEFDFAYFPVYDPDFDGTTPDIVDNDYINWYDGPGQDFSPDSVALIPFVRIDYLLRQVFAQSVPDYKFVNAWQTTHELRRLYLLNQYDARVSTSNNPPAIGPPIDLRNHVGDMKSNELLKVVMGWFCLGLFTNPFTKRITLRPLRDVLRRPAAHDWTEHVLSGYQIQDDSAETPLKFCYPQPEGRVTDRVDDEVDLPSYSSDQEFQAALGGLDDGLYYVEAEEKVWVVVAGLAEPIGYRRRCKVFADSPEFEPGLSPPLTHQFASYGHFPWFTQTGSYWAQEEGTWVRTKTPFTPELVFYRGFQESVGGAIHDRPYASNDVWNMPAQPLPARAKINDLTGSVYTEYGEAQNSLLWAGQYGLYNQWWAEWHEALRRGKHVSMRFTLPVSALVAFSFEDKIRVHSMDFIAKKLRVGKALDGARVLVDADLVSVI